MTLLDRLGAVLERLGGILGRLDVSLARLGAILGRLGAILTRLGAQERPRAPQDPLGPLKWSHVGAHVNTKI